MQHFTCADMMIERHFLCPFHICVNVRSDITWVQPRKCMSSNLYKGMTHEFQTSIRMNEIWNHAIPIVHLRGCRASKESGRHHPCLERRPNWGPPLLETGQCPDQEGPPPWKSLLIFQWSWLEGGVWGNIGTLNVGWFNLDPYWNLNFPFLC